MPNSQPRATLRRPAPFFSCDAIVDGKFQEISLDRYTSSGRWLILLFVPMAFSYVCPTEVISFNNVLDEFTEQDCDILFVSTDSKFSLLQWQQRSRAEGGLGKCQIPLLSDQSHRMSRAYGVLLEDQGIALRGTFIIDPQGVIKHMAVNDIGIGRSVLEVLRLLQAHKAEAEFGVDCAANWQPNDDNTVMKQSHEGFQDYLARNYGDGAKNSITSLTSTVSSGPSLSGTAHSLTDPYTTSDDFINTPVAGTNTNPHSPLHPRSLQFVHSPPRSNPRTPTEPTSHPFNPASRQKSLDQPISPTTPNSQARSFSEHLTKLFGAGAVSPLPSPLASELDMIALNRRNEMANKKRQSTLTLGQLEGTGSPARTDSLTPVVVVGEGSGSVPAQSPAQGKEIGYFDFEPAPGVSA